MNRRSPPPPWSSGETQANADIAELNEYDRGHLVAVELKGPDHRYQIAPMIREFNQGGKWRKLETAIGELMGGTRQRDITGGTVRPKAHMGRVRLTLTTANAIDLSRWSIEVHCFYEDQHGDPRVPVWFYVRLYHNSRLQAHFSLANRCGRDKTIPTSTEEIEFQAATDIYAGLSGDERREVVDRDVTDFYRDAGPTAPPNQILQFMHDVNDRCRYGFDPSKPLVFNTMEQVTMTRGRAYSEFQRQIIRKYNRWKNNGTLRSDVNAPDLYPGEAADIYLVLDECGGRSAPEVDHIDPSYQKGANYFINGRLVSFVHNHLYREKKVRGAKPVLETMRAAYEAENLVFFSGDRYRYRKGGLERTSPKPRDFRTYWIPSDEVVGGTQTADAYFTQKFTENVLFDAANNYRIRISRAQFPYRSDSIKTLIKERKAFLIADGRRAQRCADELALTAAYNRTVTDHAAGLRHFIRTRTAPERVRLFELINGGHLTLCQPSDELLPNGGERNPPADTAYVPMTATDARADPLYTALMGRWDAVKPEE